MKIRIWLIKKLGGYTYDEYAQIGAFKPIDYKVEKHCIEKIEVRRILRREMIPYNDPTFSRFVKLEMISDIAKKLIDDGYAKFLTRDPEPFENSVEVRCRLMVTKG